MAEEMKRFVGRIVQIRALGWRKPQLVRIIDVEVCDFTHHTWTAAPTSRSGIGESTPDV